MKVFVTEPTVVNTVSYNIVEVENSSLAEESVINLSFLHEEKMITAIKEKITPIEFNNFIGQ